MSPTMDMPGDHCDMPPKIGVAELSHPPASVADSLYDNCTVAGDTECFFAKRSTNSPSVSAICPIL
jgi:hypothetical protein